jgi:hypothetical protein
MDDISQSLPKTHHFDYLFLISLLKEYRRPREKIGLMIKNGQILRIKKGLYVLSPGLGGVLNVKVLANVIFGPSYVSLDSALSYWGLIPERVTGTISMTTKRNRRFTTPAGLFSYHHITSAAFMAGVMRQGEGVSAFLIASREKALCDKIAGAPEISAMRDVGEYLLQDLRIEKDQLAMFDIGLLRAIAAVYRKTGVGFLVRWFENLKKEKIQ